MLILCNDYLPRDFKNRFKTKITSERIEKVKICVSQPSHNRNTNPNTVLLLLLTNQGSFNTLCT